MNKEQLSKMKVDELRKLAPTVGVKNAKRYKKADLIEAILRASKSVEDNEVVSVLVESKIETTSPNGSKEDAVVQDTANTVVGFAINMEQKMKYIEDAPVGTLVAFKLPNGKVKSAKIVNRSAKSRKLKLETSYGKQFIISYTDVIWVKSTDKWPRGVYNQLKGITEDNANGKEE